MDPEPRNKSILDCPRCLIIDSKINAIDAHDANHPHSMLIQIFLFLVPCRAGNSGLQSAAGSACRQRQQVHFMLKFQNSIKRNGKNWAPA